MEILTFISNLMIPLVIMYIVAYGLLAKTDIFDAFLKGATDGLKIVFRILPTLVGLMVAICILRESGFFNVLSVILKPLADLTGFPVAVLPLSCRYFPSMSSIIKMISSSAATGLVLDIFKKFGVDSKEGYLAALLMCCSETIFYTISVYFQATKDENGKGVTNGRWLLFGALLSTFAGMAASLILTNLTH